MRLGHYPCKYLLPCGVGDKEGICKVTGNWAFRSDNTTNCPNREDFF